MKIVEKRNIEMRLRKAEKGDVVKMCGDYYIVLDGDVEAAKGNGYIPVVDLATGNFYKTDPEQDCTVVDCELLIR